MALRDLRPIWIVGIVLYFVAVVAYIVGFATTEWFTVNKVFRAGLFKVCNILTDSCTDLTDDPVAPENWRPGQGLTSAGLALLLIGGALSVAAAAYNKLAIAAAVGSCQITLGGALGVAGGIYHLVKGGELIEGGGEFSVNWSAFVFLISGVLEVISGIILIVAFRRSNSGLRVPRL